MDIKRLREIAGLDHVGDFATIKPVILSEAKYDDYDDDDDDGTGMTAAERKLTDKAEADLRKAEAAEAAKQQAKKDAETKKADAEKKEAAKKSAANPFGGMVSALAGKNHAVAKRGRGKPETERTKEFRAWVESNPKATRKDAMQFGATLGMSPTHINTKFYQFKKRLNEFWVIVNPDSAMVLSENSKAGVPLWVNYDDVDAFDSMIYATESDASEEAQRLSRFGHRVVLMHFSD